MKKYQLLFILSVCMVSWNCENTQSPDQIVEEETTVGTIYLPKGFKRVEYNKNSFGHYSQNISLKKSNVLNLYNGETKRNQSNHYRILDIDVGKKDLQQCADATMRLRAEYLWKTNQKDKIKFNFTSGHEANWIKYGNGFRPKIKGNKVFWRKTDQVNHSYANFRRYLNLVFTYCGTYSLNAELKKVKNLENINSGNIFIQTGNPYGHAVAVMDVAEDSLGNSIFLLSQSYMPAQDIHILKNPMDSKLSPWYATKFEGKLITPSWVFNKEDLKKF